MKFNIICASHDEEILNNNLASSLFYRETSVNNKQLIIGQSNVAFAYNLAPKFMNEADYNIYAHHDIFMPDDFEYNLIRAIFEVEEMDSNFGVLGPAGATIENGKRIFYEHLNDRGNKSLTEGLPKQVQTLDELLLITKGDFVFDEQFDLHFYGADICMQAIKDGRKNYAIDAYVHHNSSLKPGERTNSFRECEAKFKEKWKNYLPIATTCAIIN